MVNTKFLDSAGLTYFYSLLESAFLKKSDIAQWAQQPTKPTYTASEVGALSVTTNYAGSTSVAGPANKAVSIPFGQVDSTSTATAFTATVDGITELRDGVCVYLRNGVVTSASGYTININNLGAKRVYQTMASATASTTGFNINYTMLFVYNSSRVAGGCWDMFYGYYSDSNSVGYNIKDYAIRKTVKNVLYRYQFLFTCMDGTLLPANSDDNVTAATHVLTKESFNPFGQVYFCNSATTINVGSTPGAETLYSQATYNTYPDLRYSFNAGNTLTANNDIYIKCIPQPDGSAILADSPIVFALPTYEDGFIYKRLGKAYDTYRIILEQDKPVYYYKDGIKLWTGYNLQEGVMVTDEFTKKDSGVTSDVRVKSVGGKTVVWNQMVKPGDSSITSTVNGLTVTFSSINETITISGTYNYTSGDARLYSRFGSISFVKDHIYLATTTDPFFRIAFYLNSATNYYWGTNDLERDDAGYLYTFKAPATQNHLPIYRPISDSSYNGTVFNNVVVKFGLIDLTQMFGTGNEPTLEEFEAMFPEESYAYDAGRIVNVSMTGMKSLDANGNDLDSAELDVTTLTGVADGGSTSEIIFPNGMNGIGGVRDEIDLVNGKAVKRIGVVDIGTLTWSHSSSDLFMVTRDASPIVSKMKYHGELLCINYLNNKTVEYNNLEEGQISVTNSKSYPILRVKDTTYSDAATFKTAMSGVMLYYELATPIEYTLDTTPSCVMSVAKGGKEMILPYNASEPQCAPARIIEEYKVDYVSNKVVKSLEDRIAALELIINNNNG